jgi:hypothetical protein
VSANLSLSDWYFELTQKRHMVACSSATKPRKVFDVKKARVQGTEFEKYANKPVEHKVC